MKEIPIKNRLLVALVDDEDYDKLMQFSWRLQVHGGHAVTGVNSFKMHWLIKDCPEGMVLDHIDGNPLNNQKNNLRACTQKQNCANQKLRKDNKVGFKGVEERKGFYVAHIHIEGGKRHLGTFASDVDAAKAYDEEAKKLFGEFARLNFPNKLEHG